MQLREDPLDVRSDCFAANHEPLGDLPLVQPVGQQLQHLALPRRQRAVVTVASTLRQPAQKHANPCQQLLRCERLHEIVVASQEKTRYAIQRIRAIARDEQNHRRRALLVANSSAYLVTGKSREVHLQDNQVRLFPPDEIDCLEAEAGLRRRIAGLTKKADDMRAQVLVAVDDEQMAAVPLTRGHLALPFSGAAIRGAATSG